VALVAVTAGLALTTFAGAAGATAPRATGLRAPHTSPVASQSNLQTALTGAKTFYTQNNQSYDGLNPESFKRVGTGLTFVDGRTPSTTPQVVSMHVTDQGTAIVLADAPGTGQACWAIINTTANDEIDGFTGAGTLYVEIPNPGKAGCEAIVLNRVHQLPGSYSSTTGFGGLPG
jgi:hypothetical protein